MNPYDAAHTLAKALRESNEFKELKEAQINLKGDRSALNMLTDFRKQQFELQKQQLSGLEVADEQKEKIQKLFEVISLNTLVKNYMQAEYRVAVLLQDIQKTIGEATDELFDPELLALPQEETGEEKA
ncbi:MAG: YlbF family regulator [Firmicutes bacterium]|nr:YlbF family regulator [Bacillota bacterium]